MSENPGYRFPGMDPWLETAARWQSLHDRLIIYIADELATQIAPRYSARPGERLVIEQLERHVVPDVVVTDTRRPAQRQTVSLPDGRQAGVAQVDAPVVVRLPALQYRQPFLEIRDHESGERVVTVVELLSPSNKRAGSDARAKYLQKQDEVLQSDASLVEVDLLRAGEHTVAVPLACLQDLRPFHYLITTRRAGQREQAEVFAIPLSRRLPRLRIPLVAPDPDATAELQALLERAYELGGYARTIDYATPPDPPLQEQDAAWCRELLGVAE